MLDFTLYNIVWMPHLLSDQDMVGIFVQDKYLMTYYYSDTLHTFSNMGLIDDIKVYEFLRTSKSLRLK